MKQKNIFFIIVLILTLFIPSYVIAATLRICPAEPITENPYDLSSLQSKTGETKEAAQVLRKDLKYVARLQIRHSKETNLDQIFDTKADMPLLLNDIFRPLTKFSSAIESTVNSIKNKILKLF